MMSLPEAREIGSAKLDIDGPLFDKCLEQAGRMGVEKKHLPPMTLALALLGISKAQETSIGMQAELRDALNVVSQAEEEWKLDRTLGEKGRLS